jgi:hypothetical protein
MPENKCACAVVRNVHRDRFKGNWGDVILTGIENFDMRTLHRHTFQRYSLPLLCETDR